MKARARKLNDMFAELESFSLGVSKTRGNHFHAVGKIGDELDDR